MFLEINLIYYLFDCHSIFQNTLTLIIAVDVFIRGLLVILLVDISNPNGSTNSENKFKLTIKITNNYKFNKWGIKIIYSLHRIKYFCRLVEFKDNDKI